MSDWHNRAADEAAAPAVKVNDSSEESGAREQVMAEAVAHSLLQQLRNADECADALAFIRDKHTLEWFGRVQMHNDGRTEPMLAAFVRTCAAEGFADVLVHAAVVCPRCLDAPDRFGRTALFWAAYRGQLVTLNRLIDVGADVRATKKGNDNLLHVLAKRKVALSAARTSVGWFAKASSYLASLARTLPTPSPPTLTATPPQQAAPPPPPATQTTETTSPEVAEPVPLHALEEQEPRRKSEGDAQEADDEAHKWKDVPAARVEEEPEAAAQQPQHKLLCTSTANWMPGSLRDKLKDMKFAGAGTGISNMITQTLVSLRTMLQPEQDDTDINELSDWEEDDDDAIFDSHKDEHTPSPPPPQQQQQQQQQHPKQEEEAAAKKQAGSEDEKSKKEKHVDWGKFKDEGALSTYVPEFETLVAFTVRRLCRLLDANAPNERGETPLFLAHRCHNTLVEKYLKECGAVSPSVAPLQPVRKQLSTRDEFLERVRAILDTKQCRVPMAPRPYTRGHKYRILCMDGGGIRCLCHPVVVGRILERFPDFLDTVSMFSGCSGSSPIAAGLMLGLSVQQLKDIVALSAVQTMSKKEGNQVTGFMYTSKWNRMLCDVMFGDTRMKDLARDLVVPAFLIDNGRDGAARRGDAQFLASIGPHSNDRIADVCMRSGSAPTYFRCYQGFVDGGVFANNPATCAVSVAAGLPPDGRGADLADIVCLSLGTGYSGKPFFEDESLMSSGGIVQWGMGILDLYDLGQHFFIDNSTGLLLRDRYMRFMPPLTGIKLNNLAQLDELDRLAHTMDIQPVLDWIAKYWYG